MKINHTDNAFFEKYLADFVPERIFDMHSHLWSAKGQEHMAGNNNPLCYEAGVEELKKWHSQVFPGRECHALLLGTPVPGVNVEQHNNFLADECAKDPQSLAGMIVTPQCTPDYVADCFARQGFRVVKPYRVFAPDPAEAPIETYLPESQIEVINEFQGAVVLHLSMKDGVSSPRNLDDLTRFSKRYSNVKWVLAHCARAFNSNFLAGVIDQLRDIPNIFYDTSAVNDLYTHCLLLKKERLERIMFGSDGIVAGGVHGKYITYADAWQYYPGAGQLEHCHAEAVPVVYEQLLQQKRAADLLGLSKSDLDKLFWKNAQDFTAVLKEQ